MVDVRELKKHFGAIRAVDGISFRAGKGDVLGFLGPNGAGKSTTMKILSCFITPDGGTASVNGHDIINDSINVRRSLGYLPENVPAYEEMPVESFLSFICEARGIPKEKRAQAIERVVESCAIPHVMYQPIGTLSKGYRRRVGLAQALVHDPPVLVLDEPTDGLDPNQKYQVRQLIKKLAPQKCIIVSTHILEEVDAICNRMIIIAEGRVLIDTTPSEIQKKEGGSLDEIFRRLTTRPESRKA
ncbi:MAG: ATP-binding cassette domain-containing protein [Candidatus Wallbacteria bacterium]|nr:ATP-binding cassette domain-containing protein [Candidatus Wallbacteria bacterium]